MADIFKDINSIWTRLFNHKVFLHGEIQYTLREFEQRRCDREVDNLFDVLENITDIKVSQINRLKSSIDVVLAQSGEDLQQVLSLCSSINNLELKYQEDVSLDIAREDRKADWATFVDDMTNSCAKIDNTFDEKQQELEEFYKDLENKLHIASPIH